MNRIAWKTALALGLQTLAGMAWGQIFVPFQSNLPAGIFSDGAWADFNQDGYQDVALSYLKPGKIVGRKSYPDTGMTELYRYNPSLSRFDLFRTWSIGGMRLGWGDLDKNGWPDLVVLDGVQPATVHLNPGTGSNVAIGINGAAFSRGGEDIKIADLNRSGNQDVVALGAGDYPSCWISLGQGDNFHNIEPQPWGLTEMNSGGHVTLAVGDLNGDGVLDIVESGEIHVPTTPTRTRVSRGESANPGLLHYTAMVDLAPTSSGTITLFDYDGDGDLDILITGCPSDSYTGWSVVLYRNDGNFVFTPVANTGLDAFGHSTADFADINLDGKPDLVISGNTAAGLRTAVYLNQGAGANPIFVETSPGSIPGVDYGSVRFGDFNHDSRPDLLATGTLANGQHNTTVYRNTLP